MSNQQVTLFQQEAGAQLDPRFQPLVKAGVGADLGDGIRSGYGIVGIKAGKFRLKYQGSEQVLMQADGISPVAYIDVVIVKANNFLNKQYFEGKYAEGATAPPVCYSLDGVKPSDASVTKQATSCALCPKNQFGSLIGENGVKQKACRDTKKLAVVPLADIRNATMGGAMLFRVPPSSLKGLSIMAEALKGRGYPYNSVAVRIAFDQQASHPKPTFEALRPLRGDEVDAVLEMFQSDSVARVLADNDVVVEHGEEVAQPVQPPAPVQPAGMQRRPVTPFPTAEETRPVPQAPAQPPVLPPTLAEMAAQLAAGQEVPSVVPALRGQVPVPRVVEATPRVLRVQPDDPPPAAAAAPAPNPFAQPAATPAPRPEISRAAPASTQAAPAAANPFAPPPSVKPAKAKAAPVTVDATPVEAEAPQENTQLSQDISSILAGLGMPTNN